MKGNIDKIYENETNSGKPWWSVIIDGERHSTFSQSIINQCQEETEIEYEWRHDKTGQFKNLVSVNGVRESKGAPQQRQAKPQPPPRAGTTSIGNSINTDGIAQAITDGCKLIADAILHTHQTGAVALAQDVFPDSKVVDNPEDEDAA